MSIFRSTGDSAEDQMSDAVGCVSIALIIAAILVIGGIVLLIRHFT